MNFARVPPVSTVPIRHGVRERESLSECEAMTGFLTNRMVQLAFGSAVAILLLVGGLSYRSVVVTRENNYSGATHPRGSGKSR